MSCKSLITAIVILSASLLCLGIDSPAPAPSGAPQLVLTGLHARRVAGQKRGALAGPSSQPAQAGADSADRGPGHPLFRLMDTNRDGKLQPAEIGRIIDVLKAAQDASQKADLTPEEWSKFAEQLRPRGGGKALRGKLKANKT